MSNSPITLDDIFALFRESEQQRLAQEEAKQQQFDKLSKLIAQTNKQVAGLTSRWGEFVENLVRPAAVRIFQEQGIDVHHSALRVTGQDEQGSMEIDILVENTIEVVAIEVKSHLEVRDVKRFLKTLDRFKTVFPKYQPYQLYGAVAGIKIDERADQFATQSGLFLIQPEGESVAIANRGIIQPRIW